MSDLISRQAVIDRINKQREHLHPDTDNRDFIGDYAYKICIEFIERMPSAQPELEQKILTAGYEGKEIRIYIGGRLFAIRELAQ